MLITLLVLLAGLAMLLAIPVDVMFALHREQRFRANVTIGWCFGLVRMPAGGGKARTSVRDATPSPPPPRRKRGRRHVWAMLRSEGFLARVMRLLRRLLTSIRIRRLRLHMHLGLDDPADTGQLWGMVWPLAKAIPVPAGADVSIRPEFSGETFRIDTEGTVRIVPLEIVATVIAFVFSPVTWRALYALRSGR